MGAMFFGQYLLSKGVINREALLDAINRQRKANVSLTELAVRRGDMDRRQETSVLTRYRMTDADLEELCLEYMDRERLDELIAAQRSDWVRIGAALVAGGHLTRDQVEERLVDFQDMQREADQQLDADFRACRDPKTAKAVVELAVFHLARLTDCPIKLRSVERDGGSLAGGLRRYAQKLVGDRELHVVLDLPQSVAGLVADGLVGIPLEADSEAAVDAVCEFVNIIGGNACTQLETDGFKLRPEPPFSTLGDEPSDGNEVAVRAQALAGEAEFDIQVFLW